MFGRKIKDFFSLGITTPVSERMQSYFWKSDAVKWTATFTVGAVGRLVGHLADNYLSLLQKSLAVESVRSLYKGVAPRALSLGAFSCLYSYFETKLKPD